MKKFVFFLMIVSILAPTIANSADDLELNQSNVLSVRQVQELTKMFNRQFIVFSLAMIFFLVLSIGPIAGLWVLRKEKNFWFKFGLVALLAILLTLLSVASMSLFKYYFNKQIVKRNPTVFSASGVFEKYVVKGGKYGETRKDIYKIDGEEYNVLTDNIFMTNGRLVKVYYIKLLDTGFLGIKKEKKMIVNTQTDYGE